jgi:surface antigen
VYDIEKFIKEVEGKKINTDGADNGECTAIPHLWQKVNGWPIVTGNADQTLDRASSSAYEKVHNSASNYPPKGAIMVWDGSWGGGYGHTAVVVSANEHSFDSVEQNNGDGGLAHVVTHPHYKGVLGWFVRR